MNRLIAALVAVGVLGAACGAGAGSGDDDRAGGRPSGSPIPFPCSDDAVASTARDAGGSGLRWLLGEPLPDGIGEPLLDRSFIVPVLRPDDIPAVDAPTCHHVDEVEFLADEEAVVVLEIDGDARAYPIQIMTWHELVNDTVGGVAVTVSYCPLCNSAIAYDRVVGDRVLDFGTSGALHQSSMVMYDRQTETLWTHFDGRGVVGELAGTELEFFPTQVVSWATFREGHPDGRVLSRETGSRPRDYGINPYAGYEQRDDPLDRFITNDVDPRLPAKDRVLGVEVAGDALAIAHGMLFDVGVVHFRLGGRELVAWNEPGTVSALDTDRVSNGIDVGSSGVFVPVADDQALTFARTDEGFVDQQTGSTWTVLGRAIDGPLAGAQLEAVPALDTFWFAWATFHQDTAIL